MKVIVIGLGYVGMSLTTIISKKYKVYAIDLDEEKILKIKNNVTPIGDSLMQSYFDTYDLKIAASTSIPDSAIDSDYAIIATPTDYDEINNSFNTTSIERVIENLLELNFQGSIIIKSTVPIRSVKYFV